MTLKKWIEIGSTIKFPKYMIAFKFPEETSTTTLLDIFSFNWKDGKSYI